MVFDDVMQGVVNSGFGASLNALFKVVIGGFRFHELFIPSIDAQEHCVIHALLIYCFID